MFVSQWTFGRGCEWRGKMLKENSRIIGLILWILQ